MIESSIVNDPNKRKQLELQVQREFLNAKNDTRRDLALRLNGVAMRAGGTGYQFVGYAALERFYRGDQWNHDEPAGASQRTDNYCAVIVDNLSSLPFDDTPEVNCPASDPTDDIETIKSEAKEKLIFRVWEDNDFAVEFDAWSKVTSLYGDGFLLGPFLEKDDRGKNIITFTHAENPGSIRLIFADNTFKKLIGYIESSRMFVSMAEKIYGQAARDRGVKLEPSRQSQVETRIDPDTMIPMVNIDKYWTDEFNAIFINDKLMDFKVHNWGFVPIERVRNIYVPNWPYGKSDIEDVLDPQMMHNRTNNDLANLLKWISTVNFWGKNLEGMQALVAGLSRIYSVPDEGELHTFEKPGDPYITNTFVQQRRTAIVEISGVSEAMLSGSNNGMSGRALAMAFQGTIRKLSPRIKMFQSALQSLNRNILKLLEIAYPETKILIEGDYRNKVFMPATLFRNVVDTINKLQSGIISLDTAQREVGVAQPKMEQKLMKKSLADPMLGPQVARQPALLPRLNEGQNQPGQSPMSPPGQQFASQQGAVNANAQQASGAAPVPTIQ